MKALSTEVKQLIDSALASSEYQTRQKADRSLVTDLDLRIEREVTALIRSRYPGIPTVGEEDPSTHREQYDFTGDYFVIDPIDGTENFVSGCGQFGSVMSLRVGTEELHIVYVPERNLFLTNLDSAPGDFHPRTDIVVMSTKCMRTAYQEVDSLRVIGSSAVMFGMVLTGQARRYTYCVGAKLWDCYTGIQLAKHLGLRVSITGHDLDAWLARPTHRTEFTVEWTP